MPAGIHRGVFIELADPDGDDVVCVRGNTACIAGVDHIGHEWGVPGELDGLSLVGR
jgi:hypothetical protein